MIGAMPTVPAPHVEVGVGVLRERMAMLAGRRADVAITWLTPIRYLDQVLLPALLQRIRERRQTGLFAQWALPYRTRRLSSTSPRNREVYFRVCGAWG
jgi:hypothetical protein